MTHSLFLRHRTYPMGNGPLGGKMPFHQIPWGSEGRHGPSQSSSTALAFVAWVLAVSFACWLMGSRTSSLLQAISHTLGPPGEWPPGQGSWANSFFEKWKKPQEGSWGERQGRESIPKVLSGLSAQLSHSFLGKSPRTHTEHIAQGLGRST